MATKIKYGKKILPSSGMVVIKLYIRKIDTSNGPLIN
jgi:hypothetical protein